MNKFLDLEETEEVNFKDINKELKYLYLRSQGSLLTLYYKYIQKHFAISPFTREWEYPWAIINSHIKNGDYILDAGCGGSPLLAYLYRRGCICYGLDNKFSDEVIPASLRTIKNRIAKRLSRHYPFYFWVNPHGIEGLSNSTKTLGFNVKYIKGDMVELPFDNSIFDRIFCISVIEHLSRKSMFKAAGELNRVLKPQGLLIVTIDCWRMEFLWQDFIQVSGLKLYGDSDFTPPLKGKYIYDTVGFVLKKE